MGFLTRIVLGVYAFVVGLACLISIILFANVGYFNRCYEALTGKSPDSSYIYVSLGFSSLFFILSLVLFIISFKTGRVKKAVGRRTSIGEIRITLVSIENIVMNLLKRLPGVKEAHAKVAANEDNVSVGIRLVVFPDISLPTLSEDIQMKVKKTIEDNTGISVGEVKVVVDNIFNGPTYKPKQAE